MNTPVTLKDIADNCGVSAPTVSRILSRRGGRHSVHTQRRVMQAAQDLGYMPNTHARAMLTGRHNSIALVLSTKQDRSHFVPFMLDGIDATLAPRDMHLTVARLPDERLCSEGFIPKFLREWVVDGLLIIYTYDVPAAMVDLIEKHRLPAIWMYTVRANDSVYQDNFNGGVRAAERLLALGHKKIAYLDFGQGSAEMDHVHYSVVDRQRGYEHAMRAAGLAPQVVRPLLGLSLDERVRFARQYLASPDRPTAVVCYWLQTATAVYTAAKTLGLNIPADLSIIAFSRPWLSEVTSINFSTMLDVDYEVARIGAERLLHKIDHPQLSIPAVSVPMQESTGSTCAPPAVE